MNTISLRSLVLALALAPATVAQVAPDTALLIKREGLENSQAMAILDELTNGVGHRLTGSDNFTRACEWAKAKFEEFGIENVQLEKWGTWPMVWNRGQWMGRVVEPVELELQVATQAWTAGTKGIVRGRLLMAPTTEEELAAMSDQLEGAYLFRTSGGRARRGRRRGGDDPVDASVRRAQQEQAAARSTSRSLY